MKSLAFVLFMISSVITYAQTINTYTVEKDVVWASPGGFDLTMDIYTPDTGKDSYPVLVIFHGGGRLINNKSIMNDMSQYVVEHGEYVVCNVNYRLLVDEHNTITMNEIVEDALGAVLWVQDQIGKYKGNPDRVAVTGDSAGGHLAEMVLIAGDKLSDSRFESVPYGFKPTYIPEGQTCKSLMKKGGLEVQAAVISYGAFDIYASAMGGFEKPSNFFWQMGGAEPRSIFDGVTTPVNNPGFYKAVSPIHSIPLSYERELPPQLFTVGSKDDLTTPVLVKAYVDRVRENGHQAEYWVHEGRPHAFMDSGKNDFLKISWETDGVPAMSQVMDFLNKIFY